MTTQHMRECQRRAALIVAAVTAAWPGCAGARCDESAPAVPNYGQQTQQTLQAQISEAPALYNANAVYQPQYSNLNLQNIATLLQGGTNVNGTAGQPGLISEYQNQIAPAAAAATAAANTTQAQSTINNVQTLGPQFQTAMNAANPQAASLLSTLTSQAGSELAAGTQLTADEQRQLNNQVNASQAARGMAYGPAASYQNVLANSQAGQQLLQQRQGFASGVVGANQQFYTDPFLGILGAPSNSGGAASALLGQSTGLLPGQQFNPGAGESVYNSQAATGSANAASGNALTGSLIGGGLQALGSLANTGVNAYNGGGTSTGSSGASAGIGAGLSLLGLLL